ncbi:MAG: translation initiation factor IF-3 [bacterium]
MTISFTELRINRQIRTEKIRVIDGEGVSLGILTVPDAVKIAEERGMDLVEISPNASPPVCKLLNYGKFRYAQVKKDKENKKKQHVVVVKEIQVRPAIGKHDFDIKLNHAMEFLDKEFKVKFVIRFRGREMDQKSVKGKEMTQHIQKTLIDKGELEDNVINEDKTMIFIIAPKKK